jgi:NAD(P)-dependent dehydrogenase (short-subunit alcohol dehydrogenase family)
MSGMNNHFGDLKGKSVLVTGGSKGIGRSIALAFADLGANVTIVGRNLDSLESTRQEMLVKSPGSSAVQADLSDIKETRRVADMTAERYGSIDVLVNNAGINIAKPAFEVTENDWDTVLDLNLKSAFFMCQAAGRHMQRQGGGKIINIASQMAFVGYYNRAAYCSSKGGLVQLTKALAVEWAPHRINVNAVAPTFVETEMTSGMMEDPAFMEEIRSRILFGHPSKPEDVNGAVLFLASAMSSFVTGDTIKVDGGWTAI